MGRGMVWAGERGNGEGLAPSEGWERRPGHSCPGTWCACLEKASKQSSFHHEPGVPSWVLIVTFHVGRHPKTISSVASNAIAAGPGEALFSTPMKSLPSHPKTWGPTPPYPLVTRPYLSPKGF